ncbi:MAG TPA: T9SS type A sorting domain-containing protein, partial [Bacteroidota bacterium]|nr:T9SS type A sorting domain-containing protein [Bacteroidota bacterium]
MVVFPEAIISINPSLLTSATNLFVADVNNDGLMDIIASGNTTISVLAGSLTPLALHLVSFTAEAASSPNVTLNWATESETNNYGFYVQRKQDGAENYSTVSGLIPGAGTSLLRHQYTFTDRNLSAGVYDYRLKEVDLTGKVTYSTEIKMTVTGVTSVKVDGAPKVFSLKQNYPNPFNPTTTIAFSVDRAEHATVTVETPLGQQVGQLFDGTAAPGKSYSVRFDGANLPSGLYYYRIKTPSHTESRKMLLVK